MYKLTPCESVNGKDREPRGTTGMEGMGSGQLKMSKGMGSSRDGRGKINLHGYNKCPTSDRKAAFFLFVCCFIPHPLNEKANKHDSYIYDWH